MDRLNQVVSDFTQLKTYYRQKMLTKAIMKKIPNIYEQEKLGDDAIVHVKYFVGDHTWYITEMNPNTGLMFGKVYNSTVPNGELGWFNIRDLAEFRINGYSIERDIHFKPTPLKDCK